MFEYSHDSTKLDTGDNGEFLLDYSKNQVNKEVLDLLMQLVRLKFQKRKKIVFKDIINKLQRSILQMSVVDVNVTNRLEFAILSQKLLSCCQYSC